MEEWRALEHGRGRNPFDSVIGILGRLIIAQALAVFKQTSSMKSVDCLIT